MKKIKRFKFGLQTVFCAMISSIPLMAMDLPTVAQGIKLLSTHPFSRNQDPCIPQSPKLTYGQYVYEVIGDGGYLKESGNRWNVTGQLPSWLQNRENKEMLNDPSGEALEDLPFFPLTKYACLRKNLEQIPEFYIEYCLPVMKKGDFLLFKRKEDIFNKDGILLSLSRPLTTTEEKVFCHQNPELGTQKFFDVVLQKEPKEELKNRLGKWRQNYTKMQGQSIPETGGLGREFLGQIRGVLNKITLQHIGYTSIGGVIGMQVFYSGCRFLHLSYKLPDLSYEARAFIGVMGMQLLYQGYGALHLSYKVLVG
jgi:hypothetical protein